MDELISRQAAIDAIDVLCQEHRYKIPGKAETYSQYNEAWQDALDRAEGAIGNLPPAQPKIGRWIHDGSKWTNRWICSECGYKWFFDCIEGAYCPNCGAKMEVTE